MPINEDRTRRWGWTLSLLVVAGNELLKFQQDRLISRRAIPVTTGSLWHLQEDRHDNIWLATQQHGLVGLLAGGDVRLSVATDYPWDGRVVIRVEATPATPWMLSLRVPPGVDRAILTVDGDGPLYILGERIVHERRVWQTGDEVILVRINGGVESNPEGKPLGKSAARTWVQRINACRDECRRRADRANASTDKEIMLAVVIDAQLAQTAAPCQPFTASFEEIGGDGVAGNPMKLREAGGGRWKAALAVEPCASRLPPYAFPKL